MNSHNQPKVEKPSSSSTKVPPVPMEVLTDAEIKRFLTQEDVATAKEMVKRTEDFGRFLSRGKKEKEQVSTSQIRDVYGTVKKLEVALWDKVKTPRQLLLLKPRLEYAAARHKGRMEYLKKVISSAIDCVGEDQANFERFCQFFEAIVAYQVAEQKTGGN